MYFWLFGMTMMPVLFCIVLVGVWPSLSIFVGAGILAILVPVSGLFWDGDVFYVLLMETQAGVWLVLLTLWVGGLGLLASPHEKHFPTQYKGCIYFLVFLLVLSFLSSDGVIFFVAFEACLGPIGLLILCWGHNAERMEAVMYLLMYTVFGGSFHVVGLMVLDLYFGSTSFLLFVRPGVESGDTFNVGIWWSCLLVGFLIKAPCYGFHLWLPKAHVEASVSGSMLLAAVMLKLGVYGIFRYSEVFIPPLSWVFPLQALGVYGGTVAVFVAIRQPDLKSVIAYASVSHMSLSVASVFTFSFGAFQGVYITMISHGLTSSGLFAWAGIIYGKVGTRNLLVMSGLREFSPEQAGALVLLIMANCGMPPFLSFFGEVFVFSSLFLYAPWLGAFLIGGVSFGLFCFIYLFIVVQHSEHFMPFMGKALPISDREWLVLGGHLVPLVLLFFCPAFVEI